MNKTQTTLHEQKLFDALKKCGVEAVILYNDGHKTVDMAVLPAKMYIEVDDLGHFTNPDQIIRDFKRNHFSDGDDFVTFYVTNQLVDFCVDDIAKALAEVVKRRVLDLKK